MNRENTKQAIGVLDGMLGELGQVVLDAQDEMAEAAATAEADIDAIDEETDQRVAQIRAEADADMAKAISEDLAK